MARQAAKKTGARPVVLVIDDDRTIADIAKVALIREGHKVLTALNGEEGLKAAREGRPSLILLDRWMPGMDGDKVLAVIKKTPRVRNVPVIMLTGDNNVTGIMKSLDLGAEDYIIKPFLLDDFVLRVNKVAQGWRRSGEKKPKPAAKSARKAPKASARASRKKGKSR